MVSISTVRVYTDGLLTGSQSLLVAPKLSED